MASNTAEVVIAGAGIAGIAAAHWLATVSGMRDVLLVDPRPPMSLTSDKSTECYRNWWPGPDGAMVALMNRSIDLLEGWAEASGNRFGLNRRGYLYATAKPEQARAFQEAGQRAAAQGAGALRVHDGQPGAPAYAPAAAEGFRDQPEGADLILDRALLRAHFPYLAEDTLAVLHARRCGWLSAQQLGMLLLEQARARGVRLLGGQVSGVTQAGGRVTGVRVATAGGEQLVQAPLFVNAAGPQVAEVAALLGEALPVYCEAHAKVAVRDGAGAVPRGAPMLIWSDAVRLEWDEAEREWLAAQPDLHGLLGPLPPGAHTRPDGGRGSQILLLLWPYHTAPVPPLFPLRWAAHEAEIVMRGVARMVPALGASLERMGRPVVDGGYYTRTRDNRPLVGPLAAEGAFVLGALSGFGVMAAPACAEVLAAHLTGAALPPYAAALAPARFADPRYGEWLDGWDDGQL